MAPEELEIRCSIRLSYRRNMGILPLFSIRFLRNHKNTHGDLGPPTTGDLDFYSKHNDRGRCLHNRFVITQQDRDANHSFVII